LTVLQLLLLLLRLLSDSACMPALVLAGWLLLKEGLTVLLLLLLVGLLQLCAHHGHAGASSWARH
jgi:hypothetical protein